MTTQDFWVWTIDHENVVRKWHKMSRLAAVRQFNSISRSSDADNLAEWGWTAEGEPFRGVAA